MKFVHTADWQLGMHRKFLAGDAAPRFDDARMEAISRVGELADSSGAEFVVVCGDVFDDNQVDGKVVGRALDRLRDFAVPVYLLPGNHDPMSVNSVYSSRAFTRECPDHVHVLGPGIVEVASGVEIVAAPWPSKRPERDLVAEALQNLEPTSGIRVLVAHGISDILTPDEKSNELISVHGIETALKAGVIDYAALGDKHSAMKVGSTGRIWYSGAHEVTDFRETNPGKALVVDIRPRSVSVKEHRVGSWSFTQMTREVSSMLDIEVLGGELANLKARDKTVLKLKLTGTINVDDAIHLDDTLQVLADRFAALTCINNVEVLADPSAFYDIPLSGFAADARDTLMEQCISGSDFAPDAQAALELMLRLAQRGA